MKTTTKRFLKKLATTAASIAMALVLVIGFSITPAASVSAEVSDVETMSAGQTKNCYWATGVYYIYLNIEETGFYELNVTDNSANDFSFIALVDYDTVNYVFTSFLENDGQTIGSGNIFLVAGHIYELALAGLNEDMSGYASGNMSVTLSKLDISVTALSTSDVSVEVPLYTPVWLSYTTSQAGDYCLNFTDFSAFIDVYNAKTGEMIFQYEDTEYDTADGWVQRDKMVFNLEANTTYYFSVERYEPETPTSIAFSMTKNAKTVKNIEPVSLAYDIYSWYDIEEYHFNFEVTYTDNTSATLTYEDLALNGIKTPSIYYIGDYIGVSDDIYLLKGGKVPVVSIYNDEYEYFYVNVISMTDWLEGNGALGDYENYDGILENDGSYDEVEGYYRVKVSSTGCYDFVSKNDPEGDDWDKIGIKYVVVLDSKNNIVQYNEEQGGWPLVAGDEYAFGIYYYFKSATSGNIEFKVQKQSSKLFPDVTTGAWYNDPVSYAVGRGVIKGYGNGNFGPGDNIQRQDFLVMLARLEGVDLEYYDYDCEFPDVPSGSYYEAAVNWGYESGIVTGYQNGKFGVGDIITREQLVAFLYRYAEYRSADTSVSVTAAQISSQYSDYKNVSDWAKEYIVWAIDKGVIKGKNGTDIAPGGSALRCEVAQIIYNIFKNDII